MPYQDLREFITRLEREGELKRISAEVDVDLEITEEHDNGFELLGIIDALGNRFIEIVPREVALVLGELDEIAQAFLALGLAGPGSDRGSAAQISQKFPTSAIAVLHVPDPWIGLQLSGAELVSFHVPR